MQQVAERHHLRTGQPNPMLRVYRLEFEQPKVAEAGQGEVSLRSDQALEFSPLGNRAIVRT